MTDQKVENTKAATKTVEDNKANVKQQNITLFQFTSLPVVKSNDTSGDHGTTLESTVEGAKLKVKDTLPNETIRHLCDTLPASVTKDGTLQLAALHGTTIEFPKFTPGQHAAQIEKKGPDAPYTVSIPLAPNFKLHAAHNEDAIHGALAAAGQGELLARIPSDYGKKAAA